jgi:hypothetical protein
LDKSAGLRGAARQAGANVLSWEAVTWATKQRMKSSHEQLVLLVLANAADPDGVAFARWPGREHWWKYLVDLTRLSKSTLFRDINTLIEVGLCSRSMLVMSDGTRRPTIQLDLLAGYKFEKTEEQNAHSHTETDDDYGAENGENSQDINDKQDGFGADEIHSHTETIPTGGNELAPAIPTGGNDPFPIVGMQEDSKLVSKELPPTPQGGLSGQRFEDFTKAWVKPIERISVAEKVWDHIPTDRRGEAIAAARGYRAFVDQQQKKPAVVSAQTFLREPKGWPQWLPYAPDASGIAPSINTAHHVDSPAGKAIVALYQIAGCEQALRSFMIRGSAVNYRMPVNPRLLALAEKTERDAWVVLRSQQAAAWNAMIRDMVTVQARQPLKEGDRAPHPWPPKVDGTWSPTGDPPQAETLMSEQDMADFN